MSRDLETFTSGVPRAVDVAGIERELTRIWAAAAESEGAGAVTRASLLNLVVRVPSPDAEAAASTTVARVSSELPCRAIVVVEDSDAGAPPLEAWISAHCTPAREAERQVCCEQVTIHAHPSMQEHVPAVVLGLLLPGLPTVVFWPGDFDARGPLASRLGRHADRWIVDSAEFASPETSLAALAAWQEEHPRAEAHDLVWDRLAVWRELVAEFFDAPSEGGGVGAVQRLEIAQGGAARGAALFFAGWFASRLAWKVESATDDGWKLRAPDRRRVDILVTASTVAHDRDLGSVQLTMQNGTRFVVEARGATRFESRVERRGSCPLPHVLEHKGLDRDAELARQLGRTRRNTALREALAQVAVLARRP